MTSHASRGNAGWVRFALGYATVACALPYLGLKIVWIAGGDLGVSDPAMMHDHSMVALNAITAGMDLVGIGLALVFTHRWGWRVPAWLLLPPIWVASGLLTRFVLAVPVAALAWLFASPAASEAGHTVARGPVQSWVYAVVYTEFAGLGIGLVLGFIFYARTRWASIFSASSSGARTPTHAVTRPLATVAAIVATAIASLQLAWACGATWGVAADLVARRTIVSHAVNTIDAMMSIAAAVGVLAIVTREPRARPLALAWTGGGSLFAWGLWHLINVLGNTALMRGPVQPSAVINVVALLQLIAGLVIGMVMLVVLAETDAHD